MRSARSSPDLATSGGILETHKIGDMAEEYGVPMAMHFAGTPVMLHGQRALRRRHARISWRSRITRSTCPGGQRWSKRASRHRSSITDGSRCPTGPASASLLNEDVVRRHLAPGTGYFEPTPQWDQERSWDRLWS